MKKEKKKIILIGIIAILNFSIGFGQMKSLGNAYVHENEVALHNNILTFDNIGEGKIPGIIATNRKDMAYLSFVGTSNWTGAANNKHVDGYAKSYDMSSFLFPIGDNGNYAPAKITSTTPGTFSAAYFYTNPSVAITSNIGGGDEVALPLGAPFNTANFESKLKSISTVEYWDIDGSSTAKVSLTWNTNSQINPLSGGDLSNIVIAGWNGTQWVEIPSAIDVTSVLGTSSSLNEGSITSTIEIVPNTYKAYTFGSKVSEINPPPKKEVTIFPNYISPNGDGVNDYFNISTVQTEYPNAKLQVYNRWGNVVYRSVGPYTNNWNGFHENNEVPLPDGIYYYVIELNGEFSDVKTGFVEIMR